LLRNYKALLNAVNRYPVESNSLPQYLREEHNSTPIHKFSDMDNLQLTWMKIWLLHMQDTTIPHNCAISQQNMQFNLNNHPNIASSPLYLQLPISLPSE
jgi:hypothetical protein